MSYWLPVCNLSSFSDHQVSYTSGNGKFLLFNLISWNLTFVLHLSQIEATSGENDSGAYEEMYVQVSAETYEKVDAAVALIELLVTPASVSKQ